MSLLADEHIELFKYVTENLTEEARADIAGCAWYIQALESLRKEDKVAKVEAIALWILHTTMTGKHPEAQLEIGLLLNGEKGGSMLNDMVLKVGKYYAKRFN